MERLPEIRLSPRRIEGGNLKLIQAIIFSIAAALGNASRVHADTIKFVPQAPVCDKREMEGCESVWYEIREDEEKQICTLGIVCERPQFPLLVS